MTDAFDAFEPFEPLAAADEERGEDESPPAAGRTPRRWTAPRPAATPDRASAQPERPSAPPDSGRPDRMPRGMPEPDDATLATLRSVALPELRAAVDRLIGRGHDAELRNQLDEDEPSLVLRFRPSAGPLGYLASGAREHARFELRLGIETHPAARAEATAPAAPDRTQVVAGHTPAAEGAHFAALGRTPVRSLTPDWVAQRVIDFVARTLERS